MTVGRAVIRRAGLAAVATALLALAAPAWAGASWTRVATPNRGGGSELAAVAARSASDAWGVGQWFDTTTQSYRSLAEHWNGSAWSVTTTVDPMTNQQLNGVAAVGAGDAWAVGFTNSSTWLANRTVVEHFSGGTWKRVSSPNPTATEDELWGVWAASPGDVWAVGNAGTSSGGSKTLIEHYNGTKWSVLPSPNASTYDNLHRVAGSSATDVWAVGTSYNSATDITSPLVEHWDGASWKIVPAPAFGGSSYLRGLAATGPADAWIVGEWLSPAPQYTPHTLVYHWDGVSWTSVSTPSGGINDFEFNGVAAKTPGDAWLVGDQENYSTGVTATLIEHWNGTAWSVVSSPTSGSFASLDAVTILPSGYAWATGAAGSGTLALRNLAG